MILELGHGFRAGSDGLVGKAKGWGIKGWALKIWAGRRLGLIYKLIKEEG